MGRIMDNNPVIAVGDEIHERLAGTHAKLMEAIKAGIRDGVVMIGVDYAAGPDQSVVFTHRVIKAKDMYLLPSEMAELDLGMQLEASPKYKQMMAQYQRAKVQRNKNLMRDLERQMKAYRGY